MRRDVGSDQHQRREIVLAAHLGEAEVPERPHLAELGYRRERVGDALRGAAKIGVMDRDLLALQKNEVLIEAARPEARLNEVVDLLRRAPGNRLGPALENAVQARG